MAVFREHFDPIREFESLPRGRLPPEAGGFNSLSIAAARESIVNMVRLRSVLGCLSASPLVALCLFSGCQPDASQATKQSAAAKAEQEKQAVSEVEDQLHSALYQLQPEHLNIDSRLEDATSVLNNWWGAVQAANLLPSGGKPADLPADRLSAEALSALQRDAFDLTDGRYIRACYLAHKISQHAGSDAANDQQRVLDVFNWVCRNVSLRRPGDPDYPSGFYEALIIGRGTAADRAVVLAAILRQLRIDSAIVSSPAAEASQAPWVFGAVVQNELLLFDCELGLPIPRGDVPAAEMFKSAATLKQIQEHPEWLSLLSTRADRPYRLTADDLKAPRIEAISPVRGWSPRIWNVEQLLPADLLCVLYDPPADGEALTGVFSRVAAAVPGVQTSAVGLWTYPEQREADLAKQDPETQRLMQAAMIPFLAPIEFEADKNTGQTQRVETLRQLRIRTSQLFGNRGDAVAQYITIRQLSVTPPPEASFGPVYQRAADDAFFWSCVCKFENGDYDSAEKVLNDYLKRYRRGGAWTFEARCLLAEALAATGDTAEAIKTLKVQESDDPYRDQHVLRIKAWTPASEPAAEQPAPAAEPTTPKPE